MRLLIPAPVYKKLRGYVLAVPTEISFLGKVQKPSNQLIILEDIQLLKQTVGAAHTVLDQEALGEFYDTLMQRGEDPSCWRAWIHSHASMTAFYSQTDEQTIESFDLERPEDNWFLSLVVNHAGTLVPRIDLFAPYRVTIPPTAIEWDIVFDHTTTRQEILRDIEEKIVHPKPDLWKKIIQEKVWIPEYIWPRILTP